MVNAKRKEGWKLSRRLVRAQREVLLDRFLERWLTVTDFGFKPLKGVVQPFLVGRSDRLKLDADPVCAAPADDRMFD